MLPLLLVASLAASPVPDLVSSYLEVTFETFPTRATETGRHDRDAELEDLSPERRARFHAANHAFLARVKEALTRSLSDDDRLDADVLLRQIRLTIHEGEVLRLPDRDPLFWTSIAANATVSLLLRDDLPLARRLASAASRVEKIPRLAAQAKAALGATSPSYFAPEHCRLGASQARATAEFYRTGLADAAEGEGAAEGPRLSTAGVRAAAALEDLAELLDAIGRRATLSPRLGPIDYPDRFALVTGSGEPVANVLARAEHALFLRRAEAAAYGREVWPSLIGGDAPADDCVLLARLFARVAEDRARTIEEFLDDARSLIGPLEAFVRKKELVTLPDPLTLLVGRSPSYFLGQSVGGVHPSGPYAPEAKTLFLLPTPGDGASAAEAEAFFRDFNRHFLTMITAHELLPGHYVQMKRAARLPGKVRSVFANGVFVEGWGTFCERLMLDAGWGGPLDRLAHLKKRMENAARAIADIRIHTAGMTREEMVRLFREEALQDEQFAANAWTRSLTSAPQLTTYFLGEEAISALVAEARARRGASFSLRELMDAILDVGPVTVPEIRAAVLKPAGGA
jgi:hypothetical protein